MSSYSCINCKTIRIIPYIEEMILEYNCDNCLKNLFEQKIITLNNEKNKLEIIDNIKYFLQSARIVNGYGSYGVYSTFEMTEQDIIIKFNKYIKNLFIYTNNREISHINDDFFYSSDTKEFKIYYLSALRSTLQYSEKISCQTIEKTLPLITDYIKLLKRI